MYLDVSETRVQPADWRVRIDGIELFEPYIQNHQRSLYSSISIGDIRELASRVDNYELIIAGDVIEHLDKEDGERVIEQLYDKATRALLVNIPLGEGWDHPECHGNPGELHRSQWSVEDFDAYPSIPQAFTLPCGAYGSFYCPKDCPPDARVHGLLAAAERSRQEGRVDRALACAWRAHEAMPTHHDPVLFLADLLLKQRRMNEVIDLLSQAIARDSAFHFAYIALAKVLKTLGRTSDARTYAQQLLAQTAVSPEVRAQAEALLST
jgi:tetratricopeptide (TPR) repeat protein